MEGVATRFTLPVSCQNTGIGRPCCCASGGQHRRGWISRLVSLVPLLLLGAAWHVLLACPAAQLISARPAQVRALAYSPSGASLAAGGDDEGIKLVDMASARVFRQLKSQASAAA